MVDGASVETDHGDNPRVKAMTTLQKEIEDFSFNARLKYSTDHSGVQTTQDETFGGKSGGINYEMEETLSPDGKEWIKTVAIKRGRGHLAKEVFEIFRSVNGAGGPLRVIYSEHKDSSAKPSKSTLITFDNVIVKQDENFAPGSIIDANNVVTNFHNIYSKVFPKPH